MLAQYVGTYVIDAGAAFTIALGGESGLTEQLTGQGAYPIYASARDRFFLRVVDARIDFERGPDGRVDALVLHQNGHDVPATRILR